MIKIKLLSINEDGDEKYQVLKDGVPLVDVVVSAKNKNICYTVETDDPLSRVKLKSVCYKLGIPWASKTATQAYYKKIKKIVEEILLQSPNTTSPKGFLDAGDVFSTTQPSLPPSLLGPCSRYTSGNEPRLVVVDSQDPNWQGYVSVTQMYADLCAKPDFSNKKTGQLCYPMPEKCDTLDKTKHKHCKSEQRYAVSAKYFTQNALLDKKGGVILDKIVFGTSGGNVCKPMPGLDYWIESELVGAWDDTELQALINLCIPGVRINFRGDTRNDLREVIKKFNSAIRGKPLEPIYSIILVKDETEDGKRGLYIDVICAKKYGAATLCKFINWALINGYEYVKLYALAHVLAFYQKLGFRLGRNLNEAIRNPEHDFPGPKVWCPDYPEEDPKFSNALEDLAIAGFGKCDAAAAFNCKNNTSTMCKDLFDQCHENGYKMYLKL